MPNTAGFRTVPHDMFPHDPTPRADFRSARSKDRDTRILRPPPDARARRVSKRRFFPGDRAPSLFSFFSFFQTREATVLEGERESSGGRGSGLVGESRALGRARRASGGSLPHWQDVPE